ncbi:MAG: hypothetical protein ACLQG3_07400 [Terracidiphilus sp.]
MATQALIHSEVERSSGLLRVVGIYAGWLPELPLSETEISTPKVPGARISVASGLGCARGAMMALGIEAAAAVTAICLYGMLRH